MEGVELFYPHGRYLHACSSPIIVANEGITLLDQATLPYCLCRGSIIALDNTTASLQEATRLINSQVEHSGTDAKESNVVLAALYARVTFAYARRRRGFCRLSP